MERAKISVVMPIFNAENHLPSTLESYCSNAFEGVELIIVDDGSTDRSLEILECSGLATQIIPLSINFGEPVGWRLSHFG